MPEPANADRKSAIVTIKRRGRRHVPDLEITPEEHKRRGDAADALFRRLVREIEEKNHPAEPPKRRS